MAKLEDPYQTLGVSHAATQDDIRSAYRKLDLPVLGQVSLSSAAIFDIGVYLVVLGLALMVFESFGDDPVEDADEAPIDIVGATALGERSPS